MSDRRKHPRLLCADLVPVAWKDKLGRSQRTMANLEDISSEGACLQVETDIPVGSKVKFTISKGVLSGEVRYSTYREIGYFLGIQFDEGIKWSPRTFRPMHLLDPRKLMERAVDRADSRVN